VFHIYIVKVDEDVAYIAMVVHGCCKFLFPMFHLFLRRMLQACLSGCCICFAHILQPHVCDGFECFYVFLQLPRFLSEIDVEIRDSLFSFPSSLSST
jgi:hypothetical protein